MTPLERLVNQPRRFGFDAAVRLLLIAARNPDAAEVVRFRSIAGLARPSADVVAISSGEGGRPRVAVSVMGLTGTAGVLPRSYTEVLTGTLRNRSRAMHEFLDLLSHRMVAHFARAGTKYRLHRMAESAALAPGADGARDAVRDVLLALAGHGLPGTGNRLQAGTDPLAHYAGLFAAHPRSADRLASLLSDWCGQPVEVAQFAGAWLVLPPEQRTALAAGGLPGRFDRLGVDAAIGARAWDPQAGIVLRIGPMSRATFEALLPDRPALRRMASLVRAFLGLAVDFSVNPVLAASEVPAAALGGAARLGWNTWMPTQGPRRRAGDEAFFRAETIERA